MKISQQPPERNSVSIHSLNLDHFASLHPAPEPINFQQRLAENAASRPVDLDSEVNSEISAQIIDENSKPSDEDLRKAFQDFVGQTLFSQMISSMRKTQEGAAYFNGGQAEKIFQSQLDQVLSQELSNAAASKISDPMFKLFQLRRS